MRACLAARSTPIYLPAADIFESNTGLLNVLTEMNATLVANINDGALFAICMTPLRMQRQQLVLLLTPWEGQVRVDSHTPPMLGSLFAV